MQCDVFFSGYPEDLAEKGIGPLKRNWPEIRLTFHEVFSDAIRHESLTLAGDNGSTPLRDAQFVAVFGEMCEPLRLRKFEGRESLR